MPANETLQDKVAWSYPTEFDPQTWITTLLPRWIDAQLAQYEQTLINYRQHVRSWQEKDPTVALPEAPMPPAMLVQACALYAKESGFHFETLAFSLFSCERKTLQFKKQRDHLRNERDYFEQLWSESKEGQEGLRMGELGTSAP